MNRNQVFSLLAGLVCGGLAGAVAVMLLAPQSGRDTRQGIANKIQEIMAAGKQAIADRRHELQREYQAQIQIPLSVSEPESH